MSNMFAITALVKANVLHDVMIFLEKTGAYDVQVRTVNNEPEKPLNDRTSSADEKRSFAMDFMRKKGKTRPSELQRAMKGADMYVKNISGFLGALISMGLVKKTKTGIYEVTK